MTTHQSIGVIAGNGVYPRTFVEAARRAGVSRLVVAAFKNETLPDLESEVDAWSWFRVGQLNKMINYFKKESIAHAVMVGQIAPKNLFDLRPDIRTLTMLGRLKRKNAETIFGAIANEMAKDGIELLPATTHLGEAIPPEGLVAGRPLDQETMEDAIYGFDIAKEMSRLDIGQTVVVKNGTVLAVEAFEGTNAAMKRGGQLGNGKALMAKVSKPKQDFRFDVPVIGAATIETAHEAGISTLVVEADCTLVLEREVIEAHCKKWSISVFARKAIVSSPSTSPS
ncbi:MAG: UDP-2,3-diacylglucosamine diphosphatase LpxI [Verrucomicrobiaceae bacterium]|jgi:DUF1009 family protein|nr:UDP-2,3-diacylglucosamine diphosphatase LpxI [Verrucomicrobiales bacterium]MDB4467764.1 UDP-2,3-diacylglucosamine diphosphatase LpxI [Verrucomicrobiales bacterium]MDF1785563.1 UDP-2,3-diacylglucosamine diphosphatase LpxI [Verrucomicrobiales bacterium]NCF94600.1 UDP-2,3-diacylglucosamine diphosphatase LpxI [Verrucomicrobiaceae bacterium]